MKLKYLLVWSKLFHFLVTKKSNILDSVLFYLTQRILYVPTCSYVEDRRSACHFWAWKYVFVHFNCVFLKSDSQEIVPWWKECADCELSIFLEATYGPVLKIFIFQSIFFLFRVTIQWCLAHDLDRYLFISIPTDFFIMFSF